SYSQFIVGFATPLGVWRGDIAIRQQGTLHLNGPFLWGCKVYLRTGTDLVSGTVEIAANRLACVAKMMREERLSDAAVRDVPSSNRLPVRSPPRFPRPLLAGVLRSRPAQVRSGAC